jgi:hypothetical protein
MRGVGGCNPRGGRPVMLVQLFVFAGLLVQACSLLPPTPPSSSAILALPAHAGGLSRRSFGALAPALLLPLAGSRPVSAQEIGGVTVDVVT